MNAVQTQPDSPRRRKAALPQVAEPAADDAATPVATVRERDLMLTWHRIAPSPLNPRTQFDEAGIAELAESIAERGLLSRLVVRRHPSPTLLIDGPDYLLIAGERRYRAIGFLIEADRWPVPAHPDGLIPCVMRDYGDDAEHLVDALVENCQREDVAPLDEARAFAALRDRHGWKNDRIAQAIGKTSRHVQMRLELVDKLSPTIQEALVQGRLPLAQARELTVAPAKLQEDALKEIEKGNWGYRTGEDTRKTLRAKLIDFEIAIFDRADFDGETSGGGGKLYTVDRERFKAHQRRAAEARCEALRQEWAWAELHDTYLYPWQISDKYDRSDDRSSAGVLVHLDPQSFVVTEHAGLALKIDDEAARQAQQDRWAADREAREKRTAAWKRFGHELMEALAGNPRVALAALIVAAIDGYEPAIGLRWPGQAALGLGPILERFIETDEEGGEGLAGGEGPHSELGDAGEAALLGAYRAIADKSIPLSEIVQAAAACVGVSVQYWRDDGPSPLLCALAADLLVPIPAELLPAEAEESEPAAEDGAAAA